MNIRTVRWKTRTGKVRYIRLYKSWRNMWGRIHGSNHAGNGATPWKGLPCDFKDWPDFRAWALTHGYSKPNCSLDRKDDNEGYLKSNCRWITRSQNTKWQNYQRGDRIACPF